MAIHFKLIKSPAGMKPRQLRQSFDHKGGFIGRSSSNDWTLKDPDRFLSARHCHVSFKDSGYYLTDLSTNGTFVNGSAEPVGRGAEVRLVDGDSIDVGDYRFKVSIDPDGQREALLRPPFAGLELIDVEEKPASKVSGHSSAAAGSDSRAFPDVLPDLKAQNDPLRLLDESQGASSRLVKKPVPVKGAREVATRSGRTDGLLQSAALWPAVKPEKPQLPDDWNSAVPAAGFKGAVAVPDRVRDPVEPAMPPSRERRTKPALRAIGKALATTDPERALVDALGFRDVLLTDAQTRNVHHTVGVLLRECIGGLMQILRSRASIKNEFRMNITTIQPAENNPVKFSANVDEVLETMFLRRSRAYMEPVEAIHEGFNAVADHQVAMIAGIRSAFRSALGKFDPLVLEEQFKHSSRRKWFSGRASWKAYQAHYKTVTSDAERSFQELFGDEFVQAYEEQLRKLENARKNRPTS